MLYPSLEIFVVDSDSFDGTGEMVKQFSLLYPQLHLIRNKKNIKGNERGIAIKLGFRAALSNGAEVIIEMDADLSHKPEYIQEFLCWIKEFDIVIGSRYISGSAEIKRSMVRKAVSYFVNFYIRKKLKIEGILDCTSGYRCYRRDALESININSIKSIEGTSTLIEMIYRAEEKGLKVKEIPITYIGRRYGRSKFSINNLFRNFRTISALRRQA